MGWISLSFFLFCFVLGNGKVLYFELDLQLISTWYFICVHKYIKLGPPFCEEVIIFFNCRLLGGELAWILNILILQKSKSIVQWTYYILFTWVHQLLIFFNVCLIFLQIQMSNSDSSFSNPVFSTFFFYRFTPTPIQNPVKNHTLAFERFSILCFLVL